MASVDFRKRRSSGLRYFASGREYMARNMVRHRAVGRVMETSSAATKSSTAKPRHASPRIVSFGETPLNGALVAASEQGFDHALLPLDFATGAKGAAIPDSEPLTPILRLRVDRFAIDHPLVERFPEFFAIRREAP